jgi:hypothetical protein
LHLGYHGNGRHFEFCSTPRAATHYGLKLFLEVLIFFKMAAVAMETAKMLKN